MAKQKMLDTAQKKVVEAVKTGAEGVKSVAGDGLGAGASAAAGVVLERFPERPWGVARATSKTRCTDGAVRRGR